MKYLSKLSLVLTVGCAAQSVNPAPAVAPAVVAAAKPVVRAPKAPVPLMDYFMILHTANASFNHDETLVAYQTSARGRNDIAVQPVGGGTPRLITHANGFINSFGFSPTQDQLVFGADELGDELTQLYLTDSMGSEPLRLFADDPKGTRADFVRWADDGKSFLYACNRRDPKHMDLYEYDLAAKTSVRLWEASGKLRLALVSRDHKQFIVAEISDADSNLFLVRRGQATPPVLLTPHKPPILYIPFDFSPDGKTLFLGSDQAGEFRGLYTIDLVTKKLAKREQPKWDVEAAGFSQGGNYFYSVVNADGAPEVTIVEAKTNKSVALPAVGAPGPLVPLATSRSDRYLAALLQTDVAPQVVWVIDLKEGKGHSVADPLPPGSFEDYAFTAGQSVRVKSFDGLEVPAFLYAPKGHGPFPAVIDVHGGPTMQARRGFDNRTQYLVSKGYVVLVPNVRGSTGYGKTYTRGDDKDFGGAPLKDIVACKQWLIDHAHVDGGKVAIMGASYGGYMTLAAATFFPKEFVAHVDISGFSDLKTLVESFPAYWAAAADGIHQKYGNPNDPKDAQYQHDRSPIHFIDKIERPLLVVQGANDPRVRKDQSDRLVEALKQRGVAVDYLVLEGEGHVFVGQNGFYIMEVIDHFLDKHIFGDTEVEVIPRF